MNIDLQCAYTQPQTYVTAYETDPRQIEHINAVCAAIRARNWPVVWTYVAYLQSRRGLRRLGHAHRHARQPAEHQGRLAAARS